MNGYARAFFTLACIAFTGCTPMPQTSQIKGNAMYWTQEFDHLLPLLGHRNWILIVDKAYPYQSARGITTLDTKAPLPEVLEKVVASMKTSTHVKPVFYTDKELDFITEEMAPGVEAYRKDLARILAGAQTQTLLHNSVFSKLDEAAKLFNVVILKTEGTKIGRAHV